MLDALSRIKGVGQATLFGPVVNDQRSEFTVKTTGRLDSAEAFSNIVLKTNANGSVVRIGDVARVKLGANSCDRYSRFNGAPTAAIGVYRSPGAHAVDVTKSVRDTMQSLARRFPNDLA